MQRIIQCFQLSWGKKPYGFELGIFFISSNTNYCKYSSPKSSARPILLASIICSRNGNSRADDNCSERMKLTLHGAARGGVDINGIVF